MNDRSITCTNQDGVKLTFAERGLTPFLLVDCEGAYLAENTVTISQNTMSDGGAYQGSVAKIRNIVLTLKDNTDHVFNRNLLQALFKSGETGNLVFSEDPNVRQIDYYVESLNSTGEDGARTYTVSLLCPDPFFYAMNDVTVVMASWVAGFEFIHEFPGIENARQQKTETGNPITIDDAYNTSWVSMAIDFESEQAGSGTPSPTNIRSFALYYRIPILVNSETYTTYSDFPITTGSWDVNTGVLKVTKKGIVFNGQSSEVWGNPTTVYGRKFFRCASLLPGASASRCDSLVPVEAVTVMSAMPDNSIGIVTSNGTVIVTADWAQSLTTGAQFKTALEQHPITLEYDDGEHTYSVSAQEGTLATGANTISSTVDGTITLVYLTNNAVVTGVGEEFGYRQQVAIEQIMNDNAANNIGMVIKLTVADAVTNPTVTKVETQEHITIGTASKPMNLTRGDTLTIYTADNNKRVTLTHDGVATNVNQYLTEDSTFIQLMRGINTFGYSADSGAENLMVEISYRLKYVSA